MFKSNLFEKGQDDNNSCMLDFCDCSDCWENDCYQCCDEGGCWDHCCSSYGD